MPVPISATYAPLYTNPGGVLFFGSDLTTLRTNNGNTATTPNPLFLHYPPMASFQPYANFTQSMHQAALSAQQQQQQNSFQYRAFSSTHRFPITSPLTVGSTPSPPAMNFSAISSAQQFSSLDVKSNVGVLVSLNPHQGVIAFSCKASDESLSDETNYVAFEIKHFGDQAVVDLTQVLRLGFALKFQAVLSPLVYDGNNKSNYVATFVAPASFEDLKSASSYNMTIAADLQRLTQTLDTPVGLEPLLTDAGRQQQQQQIPYDVERESKALQLLIDIFRQNSSPQCPLHTIHCIVSNCRDETMYNYVGKSSLKRRQFIEQRCHLFYIGADDTVCLVPGALYVAVTTLVREMLKRGGAMLLQELLDSYLTWADLPLESRELVGDTKPQFVKFLNAFPFTFSVFPSRVFVAVRRRLPDFDYSSFLIDCFGDQEGSLLWSDNQGASAAFAMAPPPPLTPSMCHTPKFAVPSTPFSATSNFSVSNDDNVVSATKFSFPPPSIHDKNSNFVNAWPSFDEASLPHLPPSGSHVTNLHNHYQSQHASTVNNTSTTNSSVGSSSLSLASFSSDPVPPTPPVVQQCMNFGQPMLTDPFGGHLLMNAIGGNNNAPLHVIQSQHLQQQQSSADNSFSGATPGFWKSYDIGTEDLVKNLSHFNNFNNFPHARSPSASLYSSNNHFTATSAQTTDFVCSCPRCGYDYAIDDRVVNVQAKSFSEFACQTDFVDQSTPTPPSSIDDFCLRPSDDGNIKEIDRNLSISEQSEEGDAKADEEGDSKTDEEGDAKADEEGDAKADEEGDAKADEEGDAKADEEGDAKADEEDDIVNSVAKFALDD